MTRLTSAILVLLMSFSGVMAECPYVLWSDSAAFTKNPIATMSEPSGLTTDDSQHFLAVDDAGLLKRFQYHPAAYGFGCDGLCPPYYTLSFTTSCSSNFSGCDWEAVAWPKPDDNYWTYIGVERNTSVASGSHICRTAGGEDEDVYCWDVSSYTGGTSPNNNSGLEGLAVVSTNWTNTWEIDSGLSMIAFVGHEADGHIEVFAFDHLYGFSGHTDATIQHLDTFSTGMSNNSSNILKELTIGWQPPYAHWNGTAYEPTLIAWNNTGGFNIYTFSDGIELVEGPCQIDNMRSGSAYEGYTINTDHDYVLFSEDNGSNSGIFRTWDFSE